MDELTSIMNVKAPAATHNKAMARLSTVCPYCNQAGSFDPVTNADDWHSNLDSLPRVFGMRRCPNSQCERPIFFALEGSVVEPSRIATFPAARLEFDSTGLPDKVRSCIVEAVTCHSVGCFNAAAVMLRRTVEEMCDDLGIAEGELAGRIRRLKDKISTNEVVVDGLHKIRIFGNQGAHSDSERFERVDKETVEVAVAVIGRLVQSAYRDQDVVDRLGAYLKSHPQPPETES